MNTVIFKWNPAFSSYSMYHYLFDLIALNEEGVSDFDWSVRDHDKIHAGDRFYWLKVGMYGQTGIVGRGTITSEPQTGEDWSGQGRKTYYVTFEAETLINPDALPILTTAELQRELPDFQWDGGPSGLVLTPEQAEKLDYIWSRFIRTNAPAFEKACASESRMEFAPIMPSAAKVRVSKAATLDRGDQDLIYSKAYNETHRPKEEPKEEPEKEPSERQLYFKKVRSDAEQGIWTEDVRELIEGFDLINGKIGNFSDTELLHYEINYEEDFIRMKLHMHNETNTLLEFRFEGEIYQDLIIDDLRNIESGYFYRDEDGRVVLTFDESYAEFSSRKIKVVSITQGEAGND